MKKISYTLLLLIMAMLATPLSGANLNALAAEADDEEEEEPYVEPPFTVVLDIDNPEAVRVTVNNQPVSHTAGENAITVDPGEGFIMVYVNDGYAFTRFTDTSTDSDYLQYSVQTYPVTIRKYLKVNMEDDPINNDGHHFAISTISMADLEQFTVTVTVDDASLVDLRIGVSSDTYSTANRRVSLHNGVNTVNYTELDKYLLITSLDFTQPIFNATCDGKNMASDGMFNSTYSMVLKGAKTDGSQIEVTAHKPEVADTYSFTATIDDPDYIKYFTKIPANKDLTLLAGDNTVTFSEGDSFEIWVSKEATECTFNGQPANYNPNWRCYTFTPVDGGHLVVSFANQVKLDKQFAFILEAATPIVNTWMRTASGRDIEFDQGNNKIAFNAEADGDISFYFPQCLAGVYLNGSPLAETDGVYTFTPADLDIVRIYRSDAPATHRVCFSVTQKAKGKFTIVRDEMQTVDTTADADELHDTSYLLVPADGAKVRVFLTIPAYWRAADADDITEELTPNSLGQYAIPVYTDMTITVMDGTESAITSISADTDLDAPTYYYNLQGVRVAAPASGLYIRKDPGAAPAKVLIP